MTLSRVLLFTVSALVFITLLVLWNILSVTPVAPLHFAGIPAEFSRALWIFRRLDVAVQVMLIFACALGILTFFAEKDAK